MKSDSNLCADCGARSSPARRLCSACSTPVVLDAKGSIEIWRLGEIRPAALNGVARAVSKSLKLPTLVQPSFLDPRPSRRTGWNGVSATALLNQIDRRSRRGTAFTLGNRNDYGTEVNFIKNNSEQAAPPMATRAQNKLWLPSRHVCTLTFCQQIETLLICQPTM